MTKPKLSPAAEKRLRDEVKKLSDDWFEHDSGDGFGRATDEEIEYIVDFIVKKLARQKRETLERILGMIEVDIEKLDHYTDELGHTISMKRADYDDIISKLKHEE